MSTLSYQSIIDAMDETAAGTAPSMLLLPAHNNITCDEDDEQISDDEHHRKKPNNNSKNSSNSNPIMTESSVLDGNDRNNTLNTETPLLTGHDDENQHDDTSAMMPTSSTAPIAKIITIKTYRPAKVGAALIVLIAIFVLIIAAISSEWLGRFDSPDSPKGTTFYRYGIFEFCYGYLNRKTAETIDGKCQIYPILYKTWVQICAGLYAGAMFIAFSALIVLCAAFKLDTDNLSKWRLYKAAVALLLAAGFILASCMLVWSARFLFEVTVLHRQRLYSSSSYEPGAYPWLVQQNKPSTKFSPISFPSRRTTPTSLSSATRKATPSPYHYSPVQRNITITSEMIRELHATIWPQVMASINCGWAYIAAWIGVLLLILPAVLLIIDGKKDEHICEEQLVYPTV